MLLRVGGKYWKSDSWLCVIGVMGVVCVMMMMVLYVCYYCCCCCFGLNFGLYGMVVVDNIRLLNRIVFFFLFRVLSNDDGGFFLEGLG